MPVTALSPQDPLCFWYLCCSSLNLSSSLPSKQKDQKFTE